MISKISSDQPGLRLLLQAEEEVLAEVDDFLPDDEDLAEGVEVDEVAEAGNSLLR